MVKLNMEFPKGFFEEEERCGYLISAEMKKVWAVEFDLLNEFMRVCNKYGFKYWADGGTLLGAVRHKGMIPWDDDMDIVMMRDEYEKLCKVAPEEFKYPYFWQTEETDHGCIRGHAQLRNSETTGMLLGETKRKYKFNQGIFLDIFPLYPIPDDEKALQEQTKKILHYRKRVGLFRELTYCYKIVPRKNLVKLVAKHLLHILAIGPMKKHFDYSVPYRQFEEECAKYMRTETKRITKFFTGRLKEHCIWQKSWFDETVYLPFEMFQLPAPKEYEKLLNTFYGDWHIYVKGTSAHGGCFFDTDHSYKDYQSGKLPIPELSKAKK